MTFYQNCSNSSAPLNKMATRAKNGKTFERLLLNEWMDFKIIYRNVSWVTLYRNCSDLSVVLNKMAARAINSFY